MYISIIKVVSSNSKCYDDACDWPSLEVLLRLMMFDLYKKTNKGLIQGQQYVGILWNIEEQVP